MPTSATGTWANSLVQAGFTLLEVLVVVVLIAIITSFATLAVRAPDPQERLDEEARRLLVRLELAQQEAWLRAETRGVRFAQDGYRFLVRDRQGKWQALSDGTQPGAYRLPSGLSLQLSVDGQPVRLFATLDEDQAMDATLQQPSAGPQPQVLLAGGEGSEFGVVLEAEALRPHAVSGDLSGALHAEPLP
ncbi:MAG TPA: type II secretion system minor pseudopilin GspH [Candidatus Competibacteraceae bacterium]|nr:type II secretion system minor pseudopilin GspH [Candidatus Competibacteraceae bacterium]